MVVLNVLLVGAMVAHGFRIRRSEAVDTELAFSDLIPSQKKAESTDREVFDDPDSIIPHEQAEREAIDFVPNKINKEYSEDFSNRNAHPLKTTPTVSYRFPTQSSVYDSSTPGPLYGPPTSPLYPIPPTFQNTLIPRHSQISDTKYPYATTFGSYNPNYQSPRSYFPFGYPKSPNFQPTPPPNPYIPLLYTPALTFLDESPSAHSIQVTPRSFTPQPKIQEKPPKAAPVTQSPPSLPPESNSPPQPALLTIGLQSDPSVGTNQQLLPQDQEQSADLNTTEYYINTSDENQTDNAVLTTSFVNADINGSPSYGDIDKVLELILQENPSLRQVAENEISFNPTQEILTVNNLLEVTTPQASSNVLDSQISNQSEETVFRTPDLLSPAVNQSDLEPIGQEEKEEREEALSLDISPHPEEMLNHPILSKHKSSNIGTNPAQLVISLHPEESLNIPSPGEKSIQAVPEDLDIFSDPSLSFFIQQDVPRSPKSFQTELIPEKSLFSPPVHTVSEELDNIIFQSSKQIKPTGISEIIQDVSLKEIGLNSDIQSQSKVTSQRPIRIKVPSIKQEPTKKETEKPYHPETTTVIYAFPVEVLKPLQTVEDSTTLQNTGQPLTKQEVQEFSQQAEKAFESDPRSESIPTKEQNMSIIRDHSIDPPQLNEQLLFLQRPQLDESQVRVLTEPPTIPESPKAIQEALNSSEPSPFHKFNEQLILSNKTSIDALPKLRLQVTTAPHLIPQSLKTIEETISSSEHFPFEQDVDLLQQRIIPEHNSVKVPAISGLGLINTQGQNQFPTKSLSQILPQRSHVNNNLGSRQEMFSQAVLPRNPSDYIFHPQPQQASTPFNIDTGHLLPIPHRQPFKSQQEVFANQVLLPVTFEDVSQRPRLQKSIEPSSIFNENTFDSPKLSQTAAPIERPQAEVPQTLFQSINQQAADRPVRKKQSDMSNLRSVPKSAALEKLVSIAGSDWDSSLHTGKSLLATTSSSFSCPSLSGDFPDPEKCSVYYQCAKGVAHMHTCQQGLQWNMVINMCDWQQNVDCEINKGNKGLPTAAEVKQAVSSSISKPFTVFGF